jgi:phage terminase large subunit-like protein
VAAAPPAQGVTPRLITPAPSTVPGAWFDQDEVDQVIRFFRSLKHTKGQWAGQSYDPLDWEVRYLLAPVFGWKHPDGRRIIRTAWWEMPRKGGKSTRASAVGLKLLAADKEPGAEVYAAAGAREQAGFVFDPAREMVRRSPGLHKRLRVYARSIWYPATGSSFKVISAASDLQHGANVHGAVIDEVHVHKTRDTVDVLETGTGSRRQPLIVFITTADDASQTSIYNEKRVYLEQLAAGSVVDPTFYGVVFAAPDDCDPFSEEALYAANPGIGVTVQLDYLKAQQERAKAIPGYLPTFKRLHLGIRDRAAGAWFDLRRWDDGAHELDPARLQGEECFGGLDLAATQDFTAWMLWFPATRTVLTRLFVPEAAVQRRDVGPQLRAWARAGYLTITDGDLADEQAMKAQIEADAEAFRIREVGYDSWNATGLIGWMSERGLACVPVTQTISVLNRPSKELENLVLGGDWNHGGHPVLRWMAGNVRKDEDPAGNFKPSKRRSAEKIDGIAALVNALERWLGAEPPEEADPEPDVF